MKLIIGLVFVATTAVSTVSGAAAAQDRAARFAAIDACVTQAKTLAPDSKTVNDSAVMRRRTRLYTDCMRGKGLRP